MIAMVVAMLAFSAVDEARLLSVEVLADRHASLVGRTVRVRGWIERCQPLSCGIRAEAGGEGRRISFGASPTFDRSVARLAGREAVVEATVSDRCWPNVPDRDSIATDIVVCTDRAGQLLDPRLVSVLPQHAAAGGRSE